MNKHILIIGDVQSVKGYMDFNKNSYSIITSEYEYNFLPSSVKFASNVVCKVKTPSYFDAACFENSIELILSFVDKIIKDFGPIDYVVPTHEHTVLPSAIIRTKYNIPGIKEEEGYSLRDKYTMKLVVKDFGITTPDFRSINNNNYKTVIEGFINQYGKVVLKRCNQAGSDGVFITNNLEAAMEQAKEILLIDDKVLIEQYINLPIMHFDGIIKDGEVKFLSVSKSIGTCFDFVHNRSALGTLVLKDKRIYNKAKNYVEKCLKALKIGTTVFHLEVFIQQDGEFIFLEIAGRYGGGGIPNLISKVFDFDLVQASYNLNCNLKIDEGKNVKCITPTAMLNIPSPRKKNIIIRGILGLDNTPNNIIGSEFIGPGTKVEYSSIDAFKPIARIFISDNNTTKIESTINELLSNISFIYEEA